MQVEVVADDRLIRPMLGEGDLSYEQARAEVQALLDRMPALPALAEVAARWRVGPKDDTVFAGPFTWTVIEYQDDPRAAAMLWLEDYAATLRAAGVDVVVAGWPGRC